ncbi:hypothetical protein [Flavobacterium sp.]|uniref:hypothetical protein n=1 Tax=Flavobacterium sp. TaxID=239 RepID=UPI0025BC91EC|nr:hypothetical protein [Flavobacterium sp.]MBA4277282.1 hypothetical protein [Flavobacterium sp.]
MKKSLSILLILLSFTIKAQEIESEKNTFNTIIGKIDRRDLNCSSEIERAKIDFKSKETFYYIQPEGYLKIGANRHHPFLIELLKKRGIDFVVSPEVEMQNVWYENNGELHQVKTNCYYKASNELLNLKYGSHFIKNIEKTADSLYVISKLKEVFTYPDEVDAYYIIYPKAKEFLDQKNQILKDFFENFKFPNGFIQSLDERDFLAKTSFIIKRDAKITDLNIEIEFKNSENQKFYDYIVSQLKRFIENANWKAAVSSGVTVDCRFKINFYN